MLFDRAESSDGVLLTEGRLRVGVVVEASLDP